MNFVVAALVYHSCSYISFWLFVALIEDYDFRENYSVGFPGVKEKSKEFFHYLKITNSKLHTHLKSLNIQESILILEPLMGLYMNVIPLSKSGRFLTSFFDQGWTYFYKISIALFQ